MKGAPGRDWSRLGPGGRAVRETADRLAREELIDRIWRRDAFVWKSDEKHRAIIEDALGWLDAPSEMLRRSRELADWALHARRDRRHVVLCGMGGSSLAPEVFGRVLGRPDAPELIVLDSTSPEQIRDAADRIELGATLFLISSKSGGTLETISQFRFFHERVLRRAGSAEVAGAQFVAITDSGSPLEKLAIEHRFADVFENLPGIGGRYSALSYFGLVPAALCGADLPRLLGRADEAALACRTPDVRNPGLALGAALGHFAREGRDKATIVCSAAVAPFGAWLEQLVAESTGKEGVGIVPIDAEPLGWPEDYAADRFFLYERLDGAEDAGTDEKLDRLAQEGHPVRAHAWRDRYDLGARMFVWEFAIAVAGKILGIDPFDQPNVQESKDNTNAVLAEFERTKRLPRDNGRRARGRMALHGETLERLVGQARSGRDYLALQAYADRSPGNEETLLQLRRDLRNRTRCATTVGFGPRFLHSTGQLHKGGPKEGVFLQFVDPGEGDLAVPGAPYGFATFLEAQAIGDEKALRKRALPFSGAVGAGPSADALAAWADVVRAALEKRK